MTTADKKQRKMPKGGRKGGTIFPRVALAEALTYAKKLVSKTHTSAQPIDVVLMGVIGSKHDKGKYGMSALKQYGLMEGDTKANFTASALARSISAAPPEEAIALYRQAALKPAVFKSIFDTYHGDAVSKARLKQRAADLKVHPDETANCVDLYVTTMATAELVKVEGDQVSHLPSTDPLPPAETAGEDKDLGAGQTGAPESDGAVGSTSVTAAGYGEAGEEAKAGSVSTEATPLQPRAIFNINVTLDSSLDIDKLQKQLEILKRFGAV